MKQATRCYREQKTGRKEHGSVLVELAFVLPLLVLLFLIIIDLGYALYEQQALQNAVREAARFSALPTNQIELNPDMSEERIKKRISVYCDNAGMKDVETRITITINQKHPIDIDSDIQVEGSRVAVEYSHPLLLPGLSLIPGTELTLRASAIFRNMY